MTTRYPEVWKNALMYPHMATARAELFYGNVKVGDLPIVSGSVRADRGSSVRRTLDMEVDPRLAPSEVTSKLTPYGSRVKAYRGIRMPDNTVYEFGVFEGRVESVEFGQSSVSIRGSDRGADIVDARFEIPYSSTLNIKVTDQMTAIIVDAIPGAIVNVDPACPTGIITTPATWDRERAEALDNLAQTIACDWWARPDGTIRIGPTPANVTTTDPEWIVDSGDLGVVITRTTSLDRASVYNAMVVNGEPPDGGVPAYGVARDTDPNSPTFYGGPFGKVPKFFSSQFLTTDAQAQAVANGMLVDGLSGNQSVNVDCIPNPDLMVGSVVLVSTGDGDFDGLYYINSFSLPLDPESSMSMVLNVGYENAVDVNTFARARPRVGVGISWP